MCSHLGTECWILSSEDCQILSKRSEGHINVRSGSHEALTFQRCQVLLVLTNCSCSWLWALFCYQADFLAVKWGQEASSKFFLTQFYLFDFFMGPDNTYHGHKLVQYNTVVCCGRIIIWLRLSSCFWTWRQNLGLSIGFDLIVSLLRRWNRGSWRFKKNGCMNLCTQCHAPPRF